MGIKLTNNAFATLAASINSSATSITLTTGQGARFPTLGVGDYFYATLIDTSNNLEIVKCTARSTDVLTVVRAQESTTARAYNTGDRIEIRITAQTFLDAVNEIGPTQISDEANTSTGYMMMPVGTTAQRPNTPASGMFRMNSSNGEPEWYDSARSTWVPFADKVYSIDYLIVAGGGGGGHAYETNPAGDGAGGGGAGGYLTGTTTATGQAQYSIVIGGGGGDTASGSNTTALGLTAVGGGYGGQDPASGGGANNGGNGGSGGGAASDCGGASYGGSATSGQGNKGGDVTANICGNGRNGAGGGGAGAAGVNGNNSTGAAGGAGLNWQSLGTFYAGGGGGGGGNSQNNGGAGGNGGGGGGGNVNNNGANGSANTGGGGGGGGAGGTGGRAGGTGGSGIVIIRYLGAQKGSGGTVTSSGGYTYHTFTSSGTYIG